MPAVPYSISIGDDVYSGSISYTERTRQEIAIATGAADTSVNFGGVTTGDVILIHTDQTIIIKFQSSGGTSITIDPNKPVVFTGTAMTAIYVSNSSGSTANIIFDIYGA